MEEFIRSARSIDNGNEVMNRLKKKMDKDSLLAGDPKEWEMLVLETPWVDGWSSKVPQVEVVLTKKMIEAVEYSLEELATFASKAEILDDFYTRFMY